MLSTCPMISNTVLLRTRSADDIETSRGLLSYRPARLASRFSDAGATLLHDLEDSAEVQVHLTSSSLPTSRLPGVEVKLPSPGMVGVIFRGAASASKFYIHFLGEQGPLLRREVQTNALTWFDPPHDTVGLALSILVRGNGGVTLDAVETVLPPHTGILPLGEDLVESLRGTLLPLGPTSWPTSQSPQLNGAGQILLGESILSVDHPNWVDLNEADRSVQLLAHGFSFADLLLNSPAGVEVLADLLLAWAGFHPVRAHSTTIMAWNDMAVSRRTMAILKVLDRLRFENSPYLTRLSTMLAQHAGWLAHPRNYIADHDHGLYADTALEFAARALSFHPLANRWQRIAQARFQATARSIIDLDEATVREHSPGYVAAVAELVGERRRNRLRDTLGDEIESRFESTLSALTTPDRRLVPWGDTSLSHPSPRKRRVGAYGFPQTGWTVSHHHESMVALTCSYHSRSHRHEDDLSFVFYDQEGPVVFEAGLPGYRYGAADREYAESPIAHSGVLIGVDDDVLIEPTAFGSGVVTPAVDMSWHVLMAWNPGLRGARHYRWILHHPGTVVVADLVTGESVRTVTRLIHVAPQHAVEQLDSETRLGGWVLSRSLGEGGTVEITESYHFPNPGEVSTHPVLALHDRGPGLRAFSISPAASPVGVLRLDSLASAGQIGLQVELSDGIHLNVEATPARSPRTLRLVAGTA